MSFTNDWTDSLPVDHTQFKNIPSSVRQVRIDIEQRLQQILYGFMPGEILTGIKYMPVNVQASDPGPLATTIQIYSKPVAGNPELFTQDAAGNVCQITSVGALNVNATGILQAVYPVGSVYINTTNSTNPATLFGFGTWVAIGTYALVGYKSGDANFGTPGAVVGEAEHLLLATESGVPAHTHPTTSGQNGGGSNGGSQRWTSGATQYGDNSGPNTAANAASAHNNIQPSLTVYMWQRTA